MALVASSIMLTRATLEQKGKLREARRLHSMTLTRLSLAMNWMLKGPVIRSARAMSEATLRTLRTVSI